MDQYLKLIYVNPINYEIVGDGAFYNLYRLPHKRNTDGA